MNGLTMGDLSQSYQLRQQNTSLKQQMIRLTTELATGQIAETRDVLAGNQSYLVDIERNLSLLSGYAIATAEASHFASATQDALGHVAELSASLSGSLIASGTSAIGPSGTDTSQEALSTLNAVIGTLNVDIANRHLFSGVETDRHPLADAATLLSALSTAMSGANTPDEMRAAADNWFDDPGGFNAVIYQGGSSSIAPFALSETHQTTLDVRATDPALRETLKAAALAALATDPAFNLDLTAQSELFAQTGQSLLNSQTKMIGLRADVGFVEAQIDQATARNASEASSLKFAKAALLDVDPYQTATQLEDVQFQLQSLYSVTVRMSQLSLVNFL